VSAAASANGDGAGRAAVPDHEVVIVGSGFAGLGMAIELRRQGVSEDFVVLERDLESYAARPPAAADATTLATWRPTPASASSRQPVT
jgi:glycine/D-amino acid oxidase-like deaminating enzyme